MIDSFPYDEWSEEISAFWTFGPQDSTGTYILTVLGIIAMVASLIGWVLLEKQKLEAQAELSTCGGRDSRAGRCSRPDARALATAVGRPVHQPRRLRRIGMIDRGSSHRKRQIEFPKEQSQDPRVTPFMIVLSAVCIVIVVILVAAESTGRSSARGRQLGLLCTGCRGSSFTARSAVASRRTGSCRARPGGTWRSRMVRRFASAPICKVSNCDWEERLRAQVRHPDAALTEPPSASRSDRPANGSGSGVLQSAAR